MADACLSAIGVETSAYAVARHYGRELLDGWLVDTVDKDTAEALSAEGLPSRAVPLWMSDADRTRQIALDALELAAR